MSRDTVLIVLGRPNRAALLNKRTVIDHLIREIKMNAVLLHDAQRSALFPGWGHDRDTQTPQL